jgi:hypothetical protein
MSKSFALELHGEWYEFADKCVRLCREWRYGEKTQVELSRPLTSVAPQSSTGLNVGPALFLLSYDLDDPGGDYLTPGDQF